MKLGGDRSEFLCSSVYGPPLWRNKASFWDDLMKLGVLNDKPWVCVGDFNDIIKQREKRGGDLCLGLLLGG